MFSHNMFDMHNVCILLVNQNMDCGVQKIKHFEYVKMKVLILIAL